ncbi:MAG: hypothetical protein M3Y87_30870, partial [Myxococcota bacterium]|nr:hypothetical protein [Myxococcota bacterium]
MIEVHEPQAPWIPRSCATFAQKPFGGKLGRGRSIRPRARPGRRARGGPERGAATSAVGIDAPAGFATVPDARLLLLSLQHNNFVHSLRRFVSDDDRLATRVAGQRNFRGRLSAFGHAAGVPALAALALTAALACSATASAEALPLESVVSLGLPPTRVQVRVATEEDDTRITVRTGRHTADATLHARVEDAELERVVLANGSAVGVVRGRGPD